MLKVIFLLQLSIFVMWVCFAADIETPADTDIQDSINKGNEMMKELDGILENPQLSVGEKEKLKKEVDELFDGEVSRVRRSANLKGVVLEKGCCMVKLSPIVQSYSRPQSYTYIQYHLQRQYNYCGWGRRCCTTKVTTGRRTGHKNAVFYRQYDQPCPDTKKSCCAGEFWYRTICIKVAQFRAILDDIRRRETTT